MYSLANNAQLLLRKETCCDAFDCLGAGVLKRFSNSFTNRAIIDPDIIHRLRALEFSVKPTAPPSRLRCSVHALDQSQ